VELRATGGERKRKGREKTFPLIAKPQPGKEKKFFIYFGD